MKNLGSPSPESGNISGKTTQFSAECWFDDTTSIDDMDYFVKTLSGIKAKGVRPDLIGSIITHYASKWLPDLSPNHPENSISTNTSLETPTSSHVNASLMKKRFFLETLIGILPPDRDSIPCNFLLRLLRYANMVGAEQAYRAELEKRIAWQLDEASLKELMVPSFSHTSEVLLDVGLVSRLVNRFVSLDEAFRSGAALLKVAKLVDSYLAEIAVDSGLTLAEFVALAGALPAHARSVHDGLYRAIDTYLKAHPGLGKQERKDVCRLIDSRKLSPEASLHAAQNERLPVRAVIQVLFSEQAKLNCHMDWSGSYSGGRPSPNLIGLEARSQSKRATAVEQMEIKRLKEDVLRLQGQCHSMQAQIERLLPLEKKKIGFFGNWKRLGQMASVKTNTNNTSTSTDYEASDEPDEPGRICKYARSAEVERVCSPVLSLPSKAQLGNDKIYRVARDLSFQNADWVQESGGAPLMPFDDTDSLTCRTTLPGLQGTGPCTTCHKDGLLGCPGYSDLTIVFEGLYVESKENDGERVLCLLGTSLFPFSEGFANPYEYWKDHGCKQKEQSPSIKKDQIVLLLRYPQNFTLTNRAILGEMRSLHEKSDAKYFDKVHISSSVSRESKYLFASEELVARACNPCPYQDTLIDEGIQIFRGSKFCNVFQMFGSEIFDIVAVSKCNGMTKSCNNLGPFVLGRKMEETNQTLGKFRLVITNSRCVPGHSSNKHRTAKVSAVFRPISSREDRYTSRARSGLSGMTISAEGIWNSSSGQLCMVGCVGTEKGSDGCNSRLCLYFPKTFSITQRSIFLGSISSLRKTDPYASLIFKKELRPLDFWNRYNEYCKSHLFYKYSKIELATDLLKKSKSGFGTFIKTLLILRYPFIEDHNNITGLSLLTGELGFTAKALPKTLRDKSPIETIVGFEVLTLGPMFGRHWAHEERHSCKGKAVDVRPSTSASTEGRQPFNISAHLSLGRAYYSHVSELFLEGLYDQIGGKIYLIGCRNVPKSEKFSNDHLNVEGNMDCLIDVKVEYSSKTTRWLINPTVKVSIVSQMEKDNPLYFSPLSLKTALITYSEKYREIIFRQNLELIFRVLLLLASIAFVSSQLVYVKEKVEAVPFIS